MFRQLDFGSFFTYLGRNKLYTFINLLGLSLSLSFVVLLVAVTGKQRSTDFSQEKGDRIYLLSSENTWNTPYYLNTYLRSRYPEIETATIVGGDDEGRIVTVRDDKFDASILFADTAFFRVFSFSFVDGAPETALAAKDDVLLSESFARKVYGRFDPVGQTIDIDGNKYMVGGVVRDFDNSCIGRRDIIMRADIMADENGANDPQMSNAGACITFLLAKEGADLCAKRDDMLAYHKEILWTYQYGRSQEVLLTPLRDVYFSVSDRKDWTGILVGGSRSLAMILTVVAAVILLFSLMNYVNLTVAQTSFRVREMATRRLFGSSRSGIVLKLVCESVFMALCSLVLAFLLADLFSPAASRILDYDFSIWDGFSGLHAAGYAAMTLLLGLLSGIVPALVISRYTPADVVKGEFRYRTKMVYSRILIGFQNAITITMLACAITIDLQMRHLIAAPLGYDTDDIAVMSAYRGIGYDYSKLKTVCSEFEALSCVESVGLGKGTPLSGTNNASFRVGADGEISFQQIVGDSAYFRILGIRQVVDNHPALRSWSFSRQTFRELGIPEDSPELKLGPDLDWAYTVGGIYEDMQIGTIIDNTHPLMVLNIGDFDKLRDKDGNLVDYPWTIVVKTAGDRVAAREALRAAFSRVTGGVDPEIEYLDETLTKRFAQQRRLSQIMTIFTLVAVLISVLGLLAISTYYIRQRRSEIAVRKVFGSTRREVLLLVVGRFLAIIAVSFAVSVPVIYWIMTRWLSDYPYRIGLHWWIFGVAGAFAFAVALGTVIWQSRLAAAENPVESIKS